MAKILVNSDGDTAEISAASLSRLMNDDDGPHYRTPGFGAVWIVLAIVGVACILIGALSS